jgi:chromosome segregation ATPase
MTEHESMENRERVARWMEEGQLLLGRVIPGLLEQLDRMKSRADAAEQLCERARQDLAELQNQISLLRTENHAFRQEQTQIREVFGRTRDQLNQLLQPINEVCHKLQATPATSG